MKPALFLSRVPTQPAGKALFIILVALLILNRSPQPAGAENAFSIYGGYVTSENARVSVTDTFASPPQGFSEEVSFGDDVEFGLRYTYWGSYLGLAFDVSYFTATAEEGNFISYDVLPMSLLLMLRWPLLKSARFPQGRFHPYLGVGPSFIVYEFELDYISAGLTPGIITGSNGDGSEFAWLVALGFNWQLSRRHSIFVEYKHTNFDVDADDSNDYWNTPATLQIESDLTSHHLLLGYTFKF